MGSFEPRSIEKLKPILHKLSQTKRMKVTMSVVKVFQISAVDGSSCEVNKNISGKISWERAIIYDNLANLTGESLNSHIIATFSAKFFRLYKCNHENWNTISSSKIHIMQSIPHLIVFFGSRAKTNGNLSLIFAVVVFPAFLFGGRHFQTSFTCSRLERTKWLWYMPPGRGLPILGSTSC